MHSRTFAIAFALVTAGCGSAVATRGDDATPTAPPIAAEMARAPVAAPPEEALDPRSPSRVVAYVEGEVITYREILQQVGSELGEIENPADRARLEHNVLIDLLRERLIYRAAVDARVPVTRDELDAKRAKFVRELAKSGGTLEAWLHEHEMTRREFDEQKRVEIVVDKYRRAAIGHNNDPGVRVRAVTDTYVPPEEVRRYYDRHPEMFDEPAGLRYRMLLVKTNLDAADRKAAVAEARAQAEAAVARLRGGEDKPAEDWVPVYRELNQSQPDPRQPDGLCSVERGKAADWIEDFVVNSPKGAVLLNQIGTTMYVLQSEGAHEASVLPFEKAAQGIRTKLEGLRIGMAFLEVDLSVLDESTVQPEAVRADLQNTLRRVRKGYLEESER